MENTENSVEKQNDKPWLFKKGQSGNPAGRPKGTFSLKTYAKKYLEQMTDEEKLEFMEGLPKEVIWKMAEGNPKQDTDITSAGKPIIQVVSEIAKKYDSTSETSGDSEGQAQI